MKKPSSKIRDEIAKLQEQLRLAETNRAALFLCAECDFAIQPEVPQVEVFADAGRADCTSTELSMAAGYQVCQTVFEPLNRAYVDARYLPAYEFNYEQMAWLAQRI